MGRFREDHPHHGWALSNPPRARTEPERGGRVDLLALLDMGRPSSPALGHLFLGLQAWTGPTPPAFWGLLLVVCRLWDPSAPLSHEPVPHSKPPLMSIYAHPVGSLLIFKGKIGASGCLRSHPPQRPGNLRPCLCWFIHPAMSPGQLSTGMGPKVSLQMGPQVGVVGVSRRCCQGSVWSSLSPPRDCPPGCPSLCMSGKDRRTPTCPPVSLQALDFSPFFLEAVRPPGRGREAGGADFHSRPATVLAFTELPAREPIRRVRDKAGNRRNGNSAVRHGPTMQPHPSWP